MFGATSLELSKKDDDFLRDLEMMPIPIDEEVVPPDQFVREIYEIATKRAQRDKDGIYPSDLLYDMIPQVLKDDSIVWWMSQTHPIALMLLENDMTSDGQFEELASMKSELGKIIIYSDEMVKECRDCIINLCHEFRLPIREEPQEIVIEDGDNK